MGYAQFKVGTLPSAAAGDEAVSHLPWEPQNFSGGRFVSRNEIDLPVELGPVKVVPYLLGELGYWGEDIDGQPLTRAYYQAGIRATLPMWAVDPEVESTLWNVHGLAHKVEFQAEYLHAQSNQSMTQFPLYDPLDDEQIEDFRRRFTVNTFGFPAVPPPVDAGAPARSSTSGFTPCATIWKVGSPRRAWRSPTTWTKSNWASTSDGRRSAAPPTAPTSSTGSSSIRTSRSSPMPTATTSAPVVGLADYNFIWHVGDRLTLLSDGIFDFFGQGQKIVTTGMFLTRPPRGALSGLPHSRRPHQQRCPGHVLQLLDEPEVDHHQRHVDRPETAEKLRPDFQLVRVGEALLIGMNVNYNPALNTAGVGLTIEPRFVPKSGRLSQTPGSARGTGRRVWGRVRRNLQLYLDLELEQRYDANSPTRIKLYTTQSLSPCPDPGNKNSPMRSAVSAKGSAGESASSYILPLPRRCCWRPRCCGWTPCNGASCCSALPACWRRRCSIAPWNRWPRQSPPRRIRIFATHWTSPAAPC